MLPCLTMRMKRILRFAGVLSGFLFLAAACGYRLVGSQVSLPGGGTELDLPLVKNKTLEAGLEDLVSQELRKRLLADGRIRLSSDAPVELRGVITGVTRTPMSFSSLGRVNVERERITAEFRLVRKAGAEPLWESGELSSDEEYPVTADPLETERARERALREAAEDMAKTALELLLGNF
jgi:hypothetical protein